MMYSINDFPALTGDYTVQHNGQDYRVIIEFDGDTLPEEYDLVTHAASWYLDKRPGELLLKPMVFFDFSKCCKLAREGGWAYSGYNPETSEETPRQVAARAAREVFEDLKAWYHDEWCYVGVVIQYSQGKYIDSMWGIESTDTEYIREVVQEAIQGAEADRASREKHQNFLIDSRGV